MPNPTQKSEDILLGNITLDTPEFNTSIRPVNKFLGDLDVHESKFNFPDSLDFTVSYRYANSEGPHVEYLYHYETPQDVPSYTPIVFSKAYLRELEESWDGVHILSSDNSKSITPNDNWDYNETSSPKYTMTAKMELDFQSLFKKVNKISDSDFDLYNPSWLTLAMNQACSFQIQCLAWAFSKGQKEYARQSQDFASSILRVWNSGLLGYYGNLDNKRVVQRVTNTQTTRDSRNPFE